MNNPTAIGERTEAIVLAELVKRNFVVLVPFGNSQRFDFVIAHKNGTFERLQCKTARLRNGVVKFNTLSHRISLNKSVTDDYVGQIDSFISYCEENQKLYRVPIDKAPVGHVSLRLEAPKNNQANVHMAYDYEI